MSRSLENALRGLNLLAARSGMGLIAVADKDGQPILFSANLNSLGYLDGGLTGKPFENLLPAEVRPRHAALMAGFKAAGGGAARTMDGRKVTVVCADGSERPVAVTISYHAGEAEGEGVFLALIQEPTEAEHEREVKKIQSKLDALLRSGHEAGRVVAAKVAAKVSAGGGLAGILVWVASQIGPLSGPIKQIWTALAPHPSASPAARSSPSPTPSFDVDKGRLAALTAIRDELAEAEGRVVAAGLYAVVELDLQGFQLRYLADSGSRTGEEIWFFDRTGGLLLDDKERQVLKLHECLLKRKGAESRGQDVAPLDLILCPAVQLIDGKVTLRRVVALAVKPSDSNVIEPLATLLWVRSPAIP